MIDIRELPEDLRKLAVFLMLDRLPMAGMGKQDVARRGNVMYNRGIVPAPSAGFGLAGPPQAECGALPRYLGGYGRDGT